MLGHSAGGRHHLRKDGTAQEVTILRTLPPGVRGKVLVGSGAGQIDAGVWVDVLGELCGINSLTALILSVESGARPSSGHEDAGKNCQSSERKRRKVGNS